MQHIHTMFNKIMIKTINGQFKDISQTKKKIRT